MAEIIVDLPIGSRCKSCLCYQDFHSCFILLSLTGRSNRGGFVVERKTPGLLRGLEYLLDAETLFETFLKDLRKVDPRLFSCIVKIVGNRYIFSHCTH